MTSRLPDLNENSQQTPCPRQCPQPISTGPGIIYSTLATRQHVAVDMLAGLMLGCWLPICEIARMRAMSVKPVNHRFNPTQPLEFAKILHYLR